MRQGAVKRQLQSFSPSQEQKWDWTYRSHLENTASPNLHLAKGWVPGGPWRERRGPRTITTGRKDSDGPGGDKTLQSKGSRVGDVDKCKKGKGSLVVEKQWNMSSLSCPTAACQDHRLLNTSQLIQAHGPPWTITLDIAYKKSIIIHTGWRICLLNVSNNKTICKHCPSHDSFSIAEDWCSPKEKFLTWESGLWCLTQLSQTSCMNLV